MYCRRYLDGTYTSLALAEGAARASAQGPGWCLAWNSGFVRPAVHKQAAGVVHECSSLD